LNRDWQPSEHRMVRLRSKYCTGGARACSKLRLMRAQSSPSIQTGCPSSSLRDNRPRDLRVRPSLARRLPTIDGGRRHSRPRKHGRSDRARLGSDQPQRGRPRGRALHHQLRPVLVLQTGSVLRLRPNQSERSTRNQGDGLVSAPPTSAMASRSGTSSIAITRPAPIIRAERMANWPTGPQIDPSFVVTHPASLEDAPEMYKKFRDKKAGVIKVFLRPSN